MHPFNRSNATYRCKPKTKLISKYTCFCQAVLQDKVIHLITNRNKIISLMKKDKDQLLRNGDYKTNILEQHLNHALSVTNNNLYTQTAHTVSFYTIPNWKNL